MTQPVLLMLIGMGTLIIIVCLICFFMSEGRGSNFESMLIYFQNKRREKDYFKIPENEIEIFKTYVEKQCREINKKTS